MTKDWTKIYKKYKGFWVALAEDEETVLSYGKNALEALKKAREDGYQDPILVRMPKEITAYVGYGT